MNLLPYVLILLGCVAVFIIILRFADKTLPKQHESNPDLSATPADFTRPCPLCGTGLKPGQRVHSVVYPGKPDQLTDIFGCPHCFSNHPKAIDGGTGAIRRCPVCKQILSGKDYVMGRLFVKRTKNHLHVLGCTKCRGPGAVR